MKLSTTILGFVAALGLAALPACDKKDEKKTEEKKTETKDGKTKTTETTKTETKTEQ
jgi:hypothetical protein